MSDGEAGADAADRAADHSGTADDASRNGRWPTSRRELLAGLSATGGLASLAGCEDVIPAEGATSEAATPMVLYGPGQDLFDVPSWDAQELTRTTSGGNGPDSFELTSYLSVHGPETAPAESLPARFSTAAPGAHRIGILSTPAPDAFGGDLNPLAERPLGELLTSDRGRQFLSRTDVVDSPEFEWRRAPVEVGSRDVELLETATTARQYLGVAAGEDADRTILVSLARVKHEGDAVLVGEANWRRTPMEPLSGGGDGTCTDDLCQLLEEALEEFGQRFGDGLGFVNPCEQLAGDLAGPIADVCAGDDVPTAPPRPEVGITNARLVQRVEHTDVEDPSSATTIYEEPEPNLVEGADTAVVFEFDVLNNLGNMSSPLELEIHSGDPSSGSRYQREGVVRFTQSDLQRVAAGDDTVAVLHDISKRSSNPTENPVFPLETGEAKVTPVFDANKDTTAASATVSLPNGRMKQTSPLKVAFVTLQDHPVGPNVSPGDRYGNGNGLPPNPARTFESAMEYLQRTYPCDVVGWHYRAKTVPGRYCLPLPAIRAAKAANQPVCNSGAMQLLAIRNDLKRAEIAADRLARGQRRGFPNAGQFRLDGHSRSRIVNDIGGPGGNGFDVTVVIMPNIAPRQSGVSDYFDHWGQDWGGVAFGNLDYAVSTLGAANSSNDAVASSTVAQEIGHRFIAGYLHPTNVGPNNVDHPMAQRRAVNNFPQPQAGGDPLDPNHARHQNSGRVPGGDPPGVLSTGYDLRGGFANVRNFDVRNGSFDTTNTSGSVGRVPSFMSYTGNNDSTWADARINDQLIDRSFVSNAGNWLPNGTTGSREPAYMLSATGRLADGGIRYDSVEAFEGYERYTDREDAAVTVELLGPDEEVLASARVGAAIHPTHHGDEHESMVAPTFKLPFRQGGVRVRTTYDGQTTTMNPVERAVRDAVERVPPEGFEGDAGDGRGPILAALDEVAAAMDEGAYGDAAEAMGGPVRERVQGQVVDYDAALDQRGPEELVALVDRMAERLRSVAEG